jgi:hypothetical protein
MYRAEGEKQKNPLVRRDKIESAAEFEPIADRMNGCRPSQAALALDWADPPLRTLANCYVVVPMVSAHATH